MPSYDQPLLQKPLVPDCPPLITVVILPIEILDRSLSRTGLAASLGKLLVYPSSRFMAGNFGTARLQSRLCGDLQEPERRV
jgi:hypothetical protein